MLSSAAAPPETPPEFGGDAEAATREVCEDREPGLRHAAQQRHGALCSVERCVQLLVRLASLVSERQRAYQRKMQGVPVRCNASFGCILRRAAAPRRLLVRAYQPTTQLRCSWSLVRGAGAQRVAKSKRGPASMVPAARDLECGCFRAQEPLARARSGRAPSVHDRHNFRVGCHENNAARLAFMRSCKTRSWRVRANSRGHCAAFAALAPEGTERTDWRGDQLNVAFSCWRALAA